MCPDQVTAFTSLPFALWFKGLKEVWLAQERYEYSPADYLISSVNLPVTAQVIEASADVPYLGFKLEFTPSQILEVLRDSEIRVGCERKC